MARILLAIGLLVVALASLPAYAYPSAYPDAYPDAYAYPEAVAYPYPEPCGWGCRRGGGYSSGGFIGGGFIGGGYRRGGWYG